MEHRHTRALSWVLAAVLAAGVLYSLERTPDGVPAVLADTAQGRGEETLILDAGHGGEDGGAVSLTGAAESHINLSIVRRMDALLGFYGEAPVLLREDDRSLHDPEAQTLREKKASDLHNRSARIEAIGDATLISIHQNTYPNPRYHGAQVFFSPTQGSRPLAELVQRLLKEAVDPSNSRSPAQISDSVYLMNHISCRAILVECGFLSNPEEDRLLQSSAYQTKLAAVLTAGWLRRGEAESFITDTK